MRLSLANLIPTQPEFTCYLVRGTYPRFDLTRQVRDDLQSVRQLLGEEVKNRERLTKENKHLRSELKKAQEELQQKPRVSITVPAKVFTE